MIPSSFEIRVYDSVVKGVKGVSQQFLTGSLEERIAWMARGSHGLNNPERFTALPCHGEGDRRERFVHDEIDRHSLINY
jgi:hypothetical protein